MLPAGGGAGLQAGRLAGSSSSNPPTCMQLWTISAIPGASTPSRLRQGHIQQSLACYQLSAGSGRPVAAQRQRCRPEAAWRSTAQHEAAWRSTAQHGAAQCSACPHSPGVHQCLRGSKALGPHPDCPPVWQLVARRRRGCLPRQLLPGRQSRGEAKQGAAKARRKGGGGEARRGEAGRRGRE